MFILDGHVTHTTNLAAIEMAWEAGVVIHASRSHFHHARLTDSSLWMWPFSEHLGNTMMMH